MLLTSNLFLLHGFSAASGGLTGISEQLAAAALAVEPFCLLVTFLFLTWIFTENFSPTGFSLSTLGLHGLLA